MAGIVELLNSRGAWSSRGGDPGPSFRYLGGDEGVGGETGSVRIPSLRKRPILIFFRKPHFVALLPFPEDAALSVLVTLNAPDIVLPASVAMDSRSHKEVVVCARLERRRRTEPPTMTVLSTSSSRFIVAG